MDIKSKKYKYIRLILFILTIVTFVSFLSRVLGLVVSEKSEALFDKNFQSSKYLLDDVYDNYMDLYKLAFDFKSEENIKAGSLLDSDYRYREELEYEYEEYLRDKDYLSTYQEASKEEKEDFFKQRSQEIEKIKNESIKRQLISYANLREKLSKLDKNAIAFYAENGEEVFKNNNSKGLIEDFSKYPLYIKMDDQGVSVVGIEDEFRTKILSNNEKFNMENYKLYLAYSDEKLSDMKETWTKARDSNRENLNYLFINFIILAITTVLSFIYAGKTDEKDIVEMNITDKIYTDITLVLIFIMATLGFLYLVSMPMLISDLLMSDHFYQKPLLLVLAIIASIGFELILSLVRHIKNGSIFTHSLIYKIFNKIVRAFKDIYNTSSLGKKIAIIIIIYSLALFLTAFIFPITITFFIVFLIRKLKDLEEIKMGVEKIRAGDLDYKIKLEKDGELKELADNINQISEGLKNAVNNELKSERHRSELITNVSHDIRTPLTSIITYIDLMRQEENEEKKEEYLQVLEKKSARLKVLIDDLFEASKVTSGNIPVNLEKIDLLSLINQGIGELSDKIEEKDMDFIVESSSEEVFVCADGNLLWRAIENLLSNIFKYGLESSRVYIDIEDGDRVVLSIKNISKYKLNISEDELMERFKRGDESRTSQGSGLGLSITESLIRLQDGDFKIKIDGDLFKAIIQLNKYK